MYKTQGHLGIDSRLLYGQGFSISEVTFDLTHLKCKHLHITGIVDLPAIPKSCNPIATFSIVKPFPFIFQAITSLTNSKSAPFVIFPLTLVNFNRIRINLIFLKLSYSIK